MNTPQASNGSADSGAPDASSTFSAPSAQTDRFVHNRLPPPDQLPHMHYDRPELQIAAQANLVVELLDKAVSEKGFADLPMLRSPSMTLSYADAKARVDRICQVLIEDLGLVPGNRVLLRGGNSIGLALAWLAVVKAGLIAVATMPLLRAKELGDIIAKAQPSVALCDVKLLNELQAAHHANPVMRSIIPFNLMHVPGSLAVLAAAKNGPCNACPTSADDMALIAFTSGTTGKPKAAVHTHRDVLAACAAWPRSVLKLQSRDIVIGSPPLAFTFGLGGLLLFPMASGASVYFHDAPFTPELMVQAVNTVGATICITAPTFYRQMVPFAKAQRLPTLRQSVSAGEGLPDATRMLWREATGLDMVDGIGATEMFHIFISSAGADVRRGAVGKVVLGYYARVVDDNGNEVPRGTVGKLAVTGPTGCKYMDDPRQASYVKAGWNYPGDAFVQDQDGYFFYQARADDMIVSAGYNIGGPEVEDCLLQHPWVAECGVVGRPDDERGMIVKAFVVLKPPAVMAAATGALAGATTAAVTGVEAGDMDLNEVTKLLQEHVKSNLAPYKYPREIEYLSSLPRTETGKLQRFKLRQTPLLAKLAQWAQPKETR